ncbi:hypothetical protein NGUA15_04233 [Salmonella enterica]|nr:hypothetical protein NGUA15_04233 [Salmonella enterica]
MVANDRSDFNIQPAIVGFHQQVAQTMRLFGNQNHNPTASGGIEFTNRAFR